MPCRCNVAIQIDDSDIYFTIANFHKRAKIATLHDLPTRGTSLFILRYNMLLCWSQIVFKLPNTCPKDYESYAPTGTFPYT